MEIMYKFEVGELWFLVEQMVKVQFQICFCFGVCYDLLNWEFDVVGSGFLVQVMNILEGSRYILCFIEGKYVGVFIMDVLEFMLGLEELNVVFVCLGGIVMYVVKDIGYQFWKFGLFEGMKFKFFMQDFEGNIIWMSVLDGQFDDEWCFGYVQEVINVIDLCQDYLQMVVCLVLGVVGEQEKEECSIYFFYVFVMLEGQIISGCKGIVVSVDDVMDEVQKCVLSVLQGINFDLVVCEDVVEIVWCIGLGVICFVMFKVELICKIDFCWEQVLVLNGDIVFYVQYVVVCVVNILKKVEEVGYVIDGIGVDWDVLFDIDFVFVKQIVKLFEVVVQVVCIYLLYVVVQYVFDFVIFFNVWYNVKIKQGKFVINVL